MLALAIGVAGGLINGVLTARTGINGFIITLASGSAFTGINLGLTESRPFHGIPPAFVAFGDARWGFVPAAALAAADRRAAARNLPLPAQVRTTAARRRRQCAGRGAFRDFARRHGRPGACHFGRARRARGGARGGAARRRAARNRPTWLLISFAGPIIGGASLSGGSVSIVGAMLAVLVIALIENVLVLAKVDPYWVQFALGALVLVTVGLNRWRACAQSGPDDMRLSIEQGQQDVSKRAGARRRVDGVRARRNSCADGGERGWKVDAHQDHHRRTPAGLRRRQARRRAGRVRLAARRARRWDRRRCIRSATSSRGSRSARISCSNACRQRAASSTYEAINAQAREALDLLDPGIDVRAEVRSLSVAQMQLVEIAKALSLERAGAVARRANSLDHRP